MDSRLGRRWGLVFTAVILGSFSASTAAGQEPSPEARAFDFWPGIWVQVIDGCPDATATTFTVRRSVGQSVFEERWKLVYEGAEHRSTALRAWDSTAGRWRLAWADEEGRFQVWEGRKFDDHWYIVREFEIEGDRFLSRQAWLPEGRDELTRVMERSFDDGETWEARSRTRFRRVPPIESTPTACSRGG